LRTHLNNYLKEVVGWKNLWFFGLIKHEEDALGWANFWSRGTLQIYVINFLGKSLLLFNRLVNVSLSQSEVVVH
jgi:hypothetical protein